MTDLEYASESRAVSVELSEAEIARLIDCLRLIRNVLPELRKLHPAPAERAYCISNEETWAWAFHQELQQAVDDATALASKFRQVQDDLKLGILRR